MLTFVLFALGFASYHAAHSPPAKVTRLTGITSDRLTRALAFSPDGKLLASGTEGELTLWNLPKRRRLLSKELGDRIYDIEFSRKGDLLAVGLGNGEVQTWSVTRHKQRGIGLNKKHTYDGDSNNVYSVSFDRDGKLLASTGYDGVDKVFDLQSHKMLSKLYAQEGTVFAIAIHPEGKEIISAAEDIVFWNIRKGTCVARIRKVVAIGGMILDREGKSIAVADTHGAIQVYDYQSRKLLGRLKSRKSDVRKLAFSPDGKLIASGHLSGEVNLWSVSGLRLVKKLGRVRRRKNDILGVLSIAFSPDGKTVASTHAQAKDIFLWDVPKYQSNAMK